MKYNVNFSIAGLFNLAILLLILSVLYQRDMKTVKQAKCIVLCLFFADFLDIITAYTISFSDKVPVGLNYGLNIMLYILEVVCVAMLPVYISFILNEPRNEKKFLDFNIAVASAYILMCIFTPVSGHMFYFDEERVFHIGNLHSLELIVPMYFLMFSFAKLLIKRKTFTTAQFLSIVAFIAVSIAGSLLQWIAFSDILTSYFIYSIAAFLIIIGLETPDFKRLSDALKELEDNKKLLENAQKRDAEAARTMRKMTKSASWHLYFDNTFNVTSADWSDEFFWMLGYEREEVADRIQTLWGDSLHPDEAKRVLAAFNGGMEGNNSYDITYRLRHKNGEYKWYKATGDLKRDVVGDGFVYRGIIQDIDEQMVKGKLVKEKLDAMEELEKSQIALKSALEKAEAADRAKSNFLASMSHEIRTPINAVLGMNELIGRESTETNIQEYSVNVAEAGQSLLSLINDILDFSKIEAGRMEIAPAEYELMGLVRETYNMIFIRCMDKNLKLSVKNNPKVPNNLYGDEVRLRQILINFLTNSVKYTDAGEVILGIDFEEKSDNEIVLVMSVSDTGIGIKPEEKDYLFDSFKRIDLANTRKREGTGLGLSITKSFVELMGGTIEVDSEYGKGSTFTVRVPQRVVGNAEMGEFEAASSHKKKKYEASFSAPEAHILVVDDVSTNLAVMKGLLKQTGIKIDTALSGQKCLEAIREKEYNIIFLDHMMPEMDGVETFEKMKADEKHLNQTTPVVMLTANAIIGVRDEYLGMGFSDYLSKPVRADELENMLIKYLPDNLVSRK